MKQVWNNLKTTIGAVLLSCLATAALAEYPEKPINMVVGFGAGGGVDTFARTFATAAEEELGVPVVVVNQPGAASMSAARQVIGSRPDGYTLFMTNGSSLAASLMIAGDNAGIDMNTDLLTLGAVGNLVTALLVPADSPFQNAEELVAFARENPGKLRWSHPGRGSLHMLGGAVFLADNGITAQDVPFQGGGKARNALAGGQVDFGFVGVQLLSGFEEKLRALGVTSSERDPIFADVPTFAEQGLPQMRLNGPIAIYAPVGIPGEIAAKLIEAFAKAAKSKRYETTAKNASLSSGYQTPEAANDAVRAVSDRLVPVIAEMNAAN